MRRRTSGLRSQPQQLARDQIKKGILPAHRQQRFGLLQPHAGPQPPIQFDDDRLVQKLRLRRELQRGRLRQAGHGLNGRLLHQPSRPTAQGVITAGKSSNGGIIEPRRPHLLAKGNKGGNTVNSGMAHNP